MNSSLAQTKNTRKKTEVGSTTVADVVATAEAASCAAAATLAEPEACAC